MRGWGKVSLVETLWDSTVWIRSHRVTLSVGCRCKYKWTWWDISCVLKFPTSTPIRLLAVSYGPRQKLSRLCVGISFWFYLLHFYLWITISICSLSWDEISDGPGNVCHNALPFDSKRGEKLRLKESFHSEVSIDLEIDCFPLLIFNSVSLSFLSAWVFAPILPYEGLYFIAYRKTNFTLNRTCLLFVAGWSILGDVHDQKLGTTRVQYGGWKVPE